MSSSNRSRCRVLSVVVVSLAAWPLLAAEPVTPSVPAEVRAGSELKRIKSAEASYPESALRYGMECVVDLRFKVLPDGSTTDIEVMHSDAVPLVALFEENAIRAVQQWRYEPYEAVVRDGRPVLVATEARIRFRR